jgi:Spy/CpxP family protein refolding chaperone
MKNHILKFILFVSLLLNFSLLGAAGYAHYRQSRIPSSHDAQGRPSFGPATQAHIFEALSLKPDQLKPMQEKAAVFHQSLDSRHAEVARLRASLLDLMRADSPDRKAIESAIAEISGAQREMQELVIAHMLEFKSMLTPEQQRRFLDLIQAGMTEMGSAHCL